MRYILAIAATAVLTACAGYPELRDANKSNLAKLNVGMTQSAAMQVMGSKGFGEMRNPARQEQFAVGGATYTVLFYYTDQIGDNSADSGLTPVVFRNGAFVGSGWTFFRTIK
jgi:hypothetical protein